MRRAALAAYRWRGPAYYAAAVVLVTVALSSTVTLGDGARAARSLLALGALCVLVVCVALVAVGPRLLPKREAVVVAPPVAGRWLAMNSPATKVPSHGVRMYGQAYAVDLVAEPEGAERPAFGSGRAMRAPEEYPAFGEPVRAMLDGVVVRASDWRRDHRARSSASAVVYMMVEGMVREIGGPGFILGNHVVIRGDDGVFAAVAHLQRGSLAVRVGDVVQAGQVVARCGNSGNSSEPHVHAQLMDRAGVWTGHGVPMVFAGVALGEEGGAVDGMPADGQHLDVGALL